MAKTERYETVIRLNTEQAKKEIDLLEKKVGDLRKKQAATAPDSKQYQRLEKEINKNVKKLEQMQNRLTSVNKAINNMSAAGPKQLKDTIKDITALLNSGHIKRGSEEWKKLTAALKQANTELAKIKEESKASEPALMKFFKFLNNSWGAIFVLVQSISGVSTTIRKSVEDFAQMEEEMADVRKYTGLTAEQVRELNEELKKMDTRTSREELNKLAGSAGRLGISSKEAILEFVEAADMIGVALGDDLGEGAVDAIGKLAMAFGEDEKKGLKGAMLSTGSALNELAQNSSAQAGYLVDFTARVAGFGKQLGLTQAQIMGFGAVMDENMLRDEMAATAFGNMLTKMQTDTEKFAKIAGMNVKEFTELLNKDANGAILTLADNLRKAEPQTMMKMLNDMGLDGSRAVGVLSTMADKIDDVRAHQERATEAYEKATSVQGEFNTMNNTVAAEIEKCKKRFHEMSVELGEQLLPVVKYTISSTSVLVKVLSGLINILFQNIGVITKLAVVLAEYVAIQKLHYLWTQRSVIIEKIEYALNKMDAVLTSVRTKLLRAMVLARMANNGAITKTIALQRILNMVFSSNPIGAVVTVVAALTLGLWKLVEVLKRTGEEKKLINDIYDTAAEKIAEEKSEISSLLRVARDEREELGKRKEAIDKLNSIIPGYNGQLDETTGKYTENAIALQNYNSLLREKYRLEAAEDKLKELEKERFKKELEYEKKVRESYEREEDNKGSAPLLAQGFGEGSGFMRQSQRYSEENVREHLKERYEEGNKELQKQMDIVTGIRDRSKETVDFQNQMNRQLEHQRQILEGGNSPSNTTSTGGKPYKSGDDDKERRKQLMEERRRLKEAEDAAKAEADARIAAKTHEYAMGKISYRQYIQDMAKLQTDGLKARRDVYAEGSAEYEKLNRQLQERAFKGDQDVNRLNLEELQRSKTRQQMIIESEAANETITEREKQEKLRLLNETFLADKVELYKKGTLERMNAEWELEQVEERNKQEREKQYQQDLARIKEQYLGMSDETRMQQEISALDELHRKGLLKEEEYQRALIMIRANYGGGMSKSSQTQQLGSSMLTNATNAVNKEGKVDDSNPITGTIQMYSATMDKLKDLYGQDEKNHEAYLAAKQMATSQFCQQLTSEFQAVYSGINQMMTAASSLYGAQSEYEIAMTKKKYDAQIEAAGNNQAKVKKLQEQQAKEEAAIKTKYNRKQMTIQIAQALAQTAMNAISAYGAALQLGPLGLTLAPIAAAMAIAAGMLQIAAIKKQQEAQEAGYYEGGFTGGKRYRRKAGIVHEGEFVANHQAVENPAIVPFLNFLDDAQRNNTVGSITAQDVSRSMGAGGMVAPVVVQNDNAELRETMEAQREATESFVQAVNEGIAAYVVIDGPNGLHKQMKKYEELIGRG